MTSSVKKQTSLTNVEKITERAQALVLLDAGLTVKDVAKQLCKSEIWVTKWRRRRDEYKQLADQLRSGRPSEIVGIVKRKMEKITKEENQPGSAAKNLKALALI